MADPTTKKIVDEMLANGAKRLEPGDVYETPLRTRITVVSGYAAAEGSRVVCTGAMTSHRQTNGLKDDRPEPPKAAPTMPSRFEASQSSAAYTRASAGQW